MCGVTGYFTTKEHTNEAKQNLAKLLTESSSRGSDATGISWIDRKGRVQVIKQAEPAEKFVDSKQFKEFVERESPKILIGHTRLATQGAKANNKNNHPIFTKSGLALVHNGILWNDEEIAKKYKLERDAEVDSEIIVKLIEYYLKKQKTRSNIKAIQRTAGVLSGSITMAFINQETTRSLYLLASDNPLWLAYHIPTGTIYFSSEEQILQMALTRNETYLNYFTRSLNPNEFIFQEVDDDTGLEITPKGLTQFIIERPVYSSPACNTPTVYNRGDYERVGERYYSEPKKKQPKKEPPKKPEYNPISEIQRPRNYCNKNLIDRLDVLFEVLESQCFLGNADMVKIINEYKRILNTLNTRGYIVPYYLDKNPYYIAHPEQNTLITL